MVTRARRKENRRAGFTLLEMLLVVALLVALLAAVVYNFQSARRGAQLDEGGRQFEALVRFLQAQASSSGKSVQLRFGDDSSGTNMVELTDDFGGALSVVWEQDPVSLPGTFVNLADATSFVEAISERVRVDKVRLPARPSNQSTNDLAVVSEAAVGFPPITFFPDGTSDTADVVLLSRDPEDFRQMTIHIDGVTGGLRSDVASVESTAPGETNTERNTAEPSPSQQTTPAPAVTERTAAEPIDAPEIPMPEFKRETARTNDFDADFP